MDQEDNEHAQSNIIVLEKKESQQLLSNRVR